MSERKPRILQLITRLHRGGAEDHLLSIIYNLRDKYDFVVGFGSSFNPELEKKLKADNIETKNFKWLKHYNLFSILLSVLEIFIYLRKNKFDIVHTNSTEAGIAGRIAARLARVPIIVHTLHGMPFNENRKYLLRKFIIAMERFAAFFTSAFESTSETITRQYLANHIGRSEQYVTIYSGIETDKYKNSSNMVLPVEKGRFKVLMAARLTKEKGFDELIMAAKEIISKYKDIIFIISGEGEYENNIRSLINSNGLQEYFLMLGFCRDMPKLLKSVSLLVLPSYFEGTPRIISEAMAAGLPIVATNVGGIPDQIDDLCNGILILPKNPNALAKAIIRIYKDKELYRKMSIGSTQKSQKYSLSIMLKEVNDHYNILFQETI